MKRIFLKMQLNNLSEEDIASRLSVIAGQIRTPSDPIQLSFPPQVLRGKPKPASVLVPFLQKDGKWDILFTRRTDSLVEHSGQVAFPGGRSEPQDASLEETALREAHEEIGLNPANVRILGRLDSFVTITNYILTPVVARIPWPFPIRLEVSEVQRVFTIPLAWLADPANRETRPRPLPSPFPSIPVIYFHLYEGETLWGVSAQITVNLLEMLSGKVQGSEEKREG
jgi:8-oxo-dGTP pyrophosphatase MutT (NUDIX family)